MSEGGSGCDEREGGMGLRWMDNTYLPCCKSCSCAHEGAAWELAPSGRPGITPIWRLVSG